MIRCLSSPPIFSLASSVVRKRTWASESPRSTHRFNSKAVFCFSSNWHFIDSRHTQSSIKHYQIKKNDSGQWYVTERHLFPSVPELIQYHQYNAAGKWGVRSGGKGWGSFPWQGRHVWSQKSNKQRAMDIRSLKSNPPWAMVVLIDMSSIPL